MAELVGLAEAVAELVRDGDTVAFEGFTHLIPVAAGHEAIRQGRRDLTLVRMTPDLVYDPVAAVCALACAAQAPGLVATLLAAMVQEHERAAGAGTDTGAAGRLVDRALARHDARSWP